jgi:hypothetical protein
MTIFKILLLTKPWVLQDLPMAFHRILPEHEPVLLERQGWTSQELWKRACSYAGKMHCPTQAKGRFEWGTHPNFVLTQAKGGPFDGSGQALNGAPGCRLLHFNIKRAPSSGASPEHEMQNQ